MYAFIVSPVALILSAIAAMALGTLWYSPLVFGRVWTRSVGMAEMAKVSRKRMALSYLGTFIVSLIMAYALAVILKNLFIPTLHEALIAGLFVGIGFIAASHFNDLLFNPNKKSLALYLVTSGYYVVIILIQALIIFLIR